MEIKKTYYLAGIEDNNGIVEIYNGGGNTPNFCILGKGLGKAYTTKKSALNRLETLKSNYCKVLYTDNYLKTHKFCVYKIETIITKEEEYE